MFINTHSCLWSHSATVIRALGCVLVWPLFVLAHPHFCLLILISPCLCSFVLHLCLIFWLSFMLGCACWCLFHAHLHLFVFVWAHMSALNTQFIHIIIKKLIIVICIINLDKDI